MSVLAPTQTRQSTTRCLFLTISCSSLDFQRIFSSNWFNKQWWTNSMAMAKFIRAKTVLLYNTIPMWPMRVSRAFKTSHTSSTRLCRASSCTQSTWTWWAIPRRVILRTGQIMPCQPRTMCKTITQEQTVITTSEPSNKAQEPKPIVQARSQQARAWSPSTKWARQHKLRSSPCLRGMVLNKSWSHKTHNTNTRFHVRPPSRWMWSLGQ